MLFIVLCTISSLRSFYRQRIIDDLGHKSPSVVLKMSICCNSQVGRLKTSVGWVDRVGIHCVANCVGSRIRRMLVGAQY